MSDKALEEPLVDSLEQQQDAIGGSAEPGGPGEFAERALCPPSWAALSAE